MADRDGRLYTPGPMPGQQEIADGGNNKDATLCGAFPHALVRHKIGRLKDKALFVCASTHAVRLECVFAVSYLVRGCGEESLKWCWA